MKKLSAVLVLLVMLGICTSSYGYFLIYNLSGTIRGTEGTVDIKRVAIPFRGYLVMRLDNDTNSLVDSNMIIYGRDPNRHKVYVQLNASDSNAFLDSSIWLRDKRNFYELNGASPFDFRVLMMGNVYRTNIGLEHGKRIAPVLNGVITGEQGMFLGVDQELAGVGNISATLFTLATRGVNDIDNHFPITPHTQDGIIDALKNILEGRDKHYREVSIPAAPD